MTKIELIPVRVSEDSNFYEKNKNKIFYVDSRDVVTPKSGGNAGITFGKIDKDVFYSYHPVFDENGNDAEIVNSNDSVSNNLHFIRFVKVI